MILSRCQAHLWFITHQRYPPLPWLAFRVGLLRTKAHGAGARNILPAAALYLIAYK